MNHLYIILLIILLISLILDYLSFSSRKTALQLVNDMGIGYNLGNTYNCCKALQEKDLGNDEIKLFGTTLPSKNTLKGIKKNGFKTIRFQILYTNHIYNNDKINSEWIDKIKEMINFINKLDMFLILSIQHTREFWYSEGRNSGDKYINFWTQIANELISYDEHLIFESMYEIGYLIYLGIYNYEDKDYYLSQEFITIVRNSGGLNIERLLIVPMISSDYEFDLLSLETDKYKIPKDPYIN
jgi:endoglucanase